MSVVSRAAFLASDLRTVWDPSSGDGKFFYGPEYASKDIPSGAAKNVINYYLDPDAKLNFDANTNGTNILLKSKDNLNHTNADNTMVPYILEDMKNAEKGENAVIKANDRDYTKIKTIPNDDGGGTSY